MRYTTEQMMAFESILESTPVPAKISPTVYGVGINDCGFQVRTTVNGRLFTHRAYEIWRGIIRRCYSESSLINRPTYRGSSVSNEWIRFSSFHGWWKVNHVPGWHIDKDMLSGVDSIYSSSTCVFVPPELNAFITLRGNHRGPYPIGVHKQGNKFRARVNNGRGVKIYLGDYSSPEVAHAKWLSYKLMLAKQYKPLCDSIHKELYQGMVDFIIRESKESLK